MCVGGNYLGKNHLEGSEEQSADQVRIGLNPNSRLAGIPASNLEGSSLAMGKMSPRLNAVQCIKERPERVSVSKYLHQRTKI